MGSSDQKRNKSIGLTFWVKSMAFKNKTMIELCLKSHMNFVQPVSNGHYYSLQAGTKRNNQLVFWDAVFMRRKCFSMSATDCFSLYIMVDGKCGLWSYQSWLHNPMTAEKAFCFLKNNKTLSSPALVNNVVSISLCVRWE